MKTKSNSIGNIRLTLFLFSRTPKSHPKGYMLFLVVSLLITLSGLLVAYAILAKVNNLSAKGVATGNSGFYGAEGALNLRAQDLRQVFLDNVRDPIGTSPTSLNGCLQQTSLGTGDYACKVTSFPSPDDATAKIMAYSYVAPQNNGVSIEGTVPPGDTFQGLNMLENRYDLSAVTTKENASPNDVIAMTQMTVRSRQIPMFQFAAFYLNDLEILPGPDMTLGGPVHTNGSLFLGANSVLAITGQVTVGEDLFNSRKNNGATYPNGRVQIANGAGTLLNLLQGGTGSTAQTTAAMTPANVTGTWGSQVQLGVEALSIPAISTLGTGGIYNNQADINFVYAPEKTGVNVPGIGTTIIPFNVTATKRNASGVGPSTILTNAQLASLRQPILATGAAVTAGVCTPGAPPAGISPSLSSAPPLIANVLNALRRAILSETTPVRFSTMGAPLSISLRNSMQPILSSSIPPIDAADQALILASSPNQIAALGGGCFISAPIQHPNTTGYTNGVSFINNRERSPGNNFRAMSLLQINIQSLTVWNFQGVYLDNAGTGLLSANQLLFTTAAADNAAPANSFQRLGLAASDISNNGLVFHGTVSSGASPDPMLVTSTNASPYGFALVKGEQLPGLGETTNTVDPTGLTFVTDQAVYLVGDYNNHANWQPASILADSLNVLSRRCIDNTDQQLRKASGTGCGGGAFDTTINSAFLSGTDITNSTASPGYNGGLENYPRFHESWGTLTYNGSFVSTGTPERVTGRWSNQLYGAPTRVWGYETRFNNARNLPPLSPRFVFIKQEGFSRNFDQ